MVYWNEDILGPPIATLEEVDNAISSSPDALAKTIRTKLEEALQKLKNTNGIPDDDSDPYAWERGMEEADRADRSNIVMANDDPELPL